MAFYFALFNVSNANNEIKNNQRERKAKNLKNAQNNRRHSVSSTQDLGIDFKLFQKNKSGASTSSFFGLSPTDRRKSNPESQCESPSQDSQGRNSKKVTFTSSGKPIYVQRKHSHCETLTKSMYPETETSRAKRAAEWIYSIDLDSENDQNDLGSMDNGNRSRESSPLETVPEVSIAESISKYIDPPEITTPAEEHKIDEKVVSTKERIIPIVICPPAKSGISEVTKGVAVSTTRPCSRLPTIITRKSANDRSSSTTTSALKTRIPYSKLPSDLTSTNKNQTSDSTDRPSRLPKLSQIPRIRCNFNKSEIQESIPLIQVEKPHEKMIRSHVY